MNYRTVIILLCLFLLAFGLRAFRFSQTAVFETDQGMDSLFAKAIITDGKYPLVGPTLSVPHFFSPPQYYYLLAGFFLLGKSIIGASFYFAVINLAAMVLLWIAVTHIADRRTGYIALFLYAISATMVGYSRYIWQPHPAVFFAIAACAACFAGYKTEQRRWLVVGALLFALSVSMYLLSLLLLPFFFRIIFISLKKITDKNPLRALTSSALLLFSSMAVVSLPQIIFELRHGFPTIDALLHSGSFGVTVSPELIAYIVYDLLRFVFSMLLIMHPDAAQPIPSATAVFAAAFIALTAWVSILVRRKDDPDSTGTRNALGILGPSVLFAGLPVFFFYQFSNHPYRFGVLVPFLILVLAICFRYGFSGRSTPLRYFSVMMFTVYCFYNLSSSVSFVTAASPSSLEKKQAIVTTIMNDVTKRGLAMKDVAVIATRPHGAENHVDNIDVYPYVFLFHEGFGLSVPFDESGNSIDWRGMFHPITPYAVVVCEQYTEADGGVSGCTRAFETSNAGYENVFHRSFPWNVTYFLYRKIHPAV